MLDLGDQVIVLHEAAVAALVKTYAIVATHPTRRAVELESRRLPKKGRKLGYAEWQLLETGRNEEDVLEEAMKLWRRGQLVECRRDERIMPESRNIVASVYLSAPRPCWAG